MQSIRVIVKSIKEPEYKEVGWLDTSDNTLKLKFWKNGKWVDVISNSTDIKVDEDDLVLIEDDGESKIRFSDRNFNISNFIGKGYKILRKNITNNKNILTQEMISEADTIYEIRYDFDLDNNEIIIPDRCIIRFNGGSFSNGRISGNNSSINAGLYKIFNNITFTNTWNNCIAYPEWFGAIGDGKIDDTSAINNTFSFSNTVLFTNNYLVTDTLDINIYEGCKLLGANIGLSTIIYRPSIFNKPIIYVYEDFKKKYNLGYFFFKDLSFRLDGENIGGFVFGCPKLEDPDLYPCGYNFNEFDIVKNNTGQSYIMQVMFENCHFYGNSDSSLGQIIISRIKCFESSVRDCVFSSGCIGLLCFGCDNPVDTRNKFTSFDYGVLHIGSGSFTIMYICRDSWFNDIKYSSIASYNADSYLDGNRIEGVYHEALSGVLTIKSDKTIILNDDIPINGGLTCLELNNDTYTKLAISLTKNEEGTYCTTSDILITEDTEFNYKVMVNSAVTVVNPYNVVISNTSTASFSPMIVIDMPYSTGHLSKGKTVMISNIITLYNEQIDYYVYVCGNRVLGSQSIKIGAINSALEFTNPNINKITNGLHAYPVSTTKEHSTIKSSSGFYNYDSPIYTLIDNKDACFNGNVYGLIGKGNFYFKYYEFDDSVYPSNLYRTKITVNIYNPDLQTGGVNMTGFASKKGEGDVAWIAGSGAKLLGKKHEKLIFYYYSNLGRAKLIYYGFNLIFTPSGISNPNRLYFIDSSCELELSPSISSSNRLAIDGSKINQGTSIFDTNLNKKVTWNGSKWVDDYGQPADISTEGNFNDKPSSSSGIKSGFRYYCTDRQTVEGSRNGIMIYYIGDNTWVDALGRIVS